MALFQRAVYDGGMRIPGTIRDGKVVIAEQFVLPEGALVFVELADAAKTAESVRVQFPLKKATQPGSLKLSNQRIAELLEDEDISAGR